VAPEQKRPADCSSREPRDSSDLDGKTGLAAGARPIKSEKSPREVCSQQSRCRALWMK
jgi:hypothetical protein